MRSMAKLPQLTSAQVEKLLLKLEFVFKRQKGNHRVYIKNGSVITVPFRKKPIKRGTLAAILKQAGLR